MRYSTCRYWTHAHVQNRRQQTNNSTWQKRNNLEQSLIEICYQHLSYSLKLVMKKCMIIEFYIKQPDMLIIWGKFLQNMKVSNWYCKLFPFKKASSSSILKGILESEGRNWTWIGAVSSFHSSRLQHWLWINIHGNQFLINCVYSDPCWKQKLHRNIDLRVQEL